MHCSSLPCHLTLIVFSNLDAGSEENNCAPLASLLHPNWISKHSFPYASFNSESVSIAILPWWMQYFMTTHYSATMSMFFSIKNNEKKHKFKNQTSTSTCYKMHAIQCRLFIAGSNDAYVSPLTAGMVHNSLSGHYSHLGHSCIEVLKIAFKNSNSR